MSYRSAGTVVIAAGTTGPFTIQSGVVSTDTLLVVISSSTNDGTGFTGNTNTLTCSNGGATVTQLIAGRQSNNLYWKAWKVTGAVAGDTLSVTAGGNKEIQAWRFDGDLAVGTIADRGGVSQATVTAPTYTVPTSGAPFVFYIERTTASLAGPSYSNANSFTVTSDYYLDQTSDPAVSYNVAHLSGPSPGSATGITTATYPGSSGNAAGFHFAEISTSVAATGTAALTLSGSGTARATAASSTASLSLSGTGTAADQRPATGTATLTLTGTATAAVTAAGTGTLTLTGTASPRAAAAGTAALTLTATGSAGDLATATGTGSLTLTGTAAATSSGASVGAITLTGAVTTLSAAGVGTATLELTATAATTITAAGTAHIELLALGEAHKPPRDITVTARLIASPYHAALTPSAYTARIGDTVIVGSTIYQHVALTADHDISADTVKISLNGGTDWYDLDHVAGTTDSTWRILLGEGQPLDPADDATALVQINDDPEVVIVNAGRFYVTTA